MRTSNFCVKDLCPLPKKRLGADKCVEPKAEAIVKSTVVNRAIVKQAPDLRLADGPVVLRKGLTDKVEIQAKEAFEFSWSVKADGKALPTAFVNATKVHGDASKDTGRDTFEIMYAYMHVSACSLYMSLNPGTAGCDSGLSTPIPCSSESCLPPAYTSVF